MFDQDNKKSHYMANPKQYFDLDGGSVLANTTNLRHKKPRTRHRYAT